MGVTLSFLDPLSSFIFKGTKNSPHVSPLVHLSVAGVDGADLGSKKPMLDVFQRILRYHPIKASRLCQSLCFLLQPLKFKFFPKQTEKKKRIKPGMLVTETSTGGQVTETIPASPSDSNSSWEFGFVGRYR